MTVDQYSQATAVEPGAVIGSYRVISELGRGGMGVVYLAEHTIMGKQAAVKVLLPEYSGREDLVARFFNEARAAARLHHPAFVEVYDCGFAEGCAYIVMEYVVGENLTSCLKRELRLPVARAIGLTRVIAEAMSVAHENGIVHRDLKPDNILLPSDARASRVGPHPVKILDFGIAKHRTNLRMTKTGTLMGTPLYMSPEQCRGSVHVDGRSDLYSVGCILYAMLTGTPPFVREGDGIVLIAHLNDPVPPLESHGVSVIPELEKTLMKALAKDPMDRQQSMTELVAELDAADDTPGRGTMPGREKAGKTDPGATVAPAPAPRPRVPTPVVAPLEAANTTLNRASGQVAAAPAPQRAPRSRWAVMGAVAFGVATAILVVGRPHRTAPPVPAQPPVAVTPPVVTPPPAQPQPPPPPTRTVVDLDTDPPGATVRDPSQAEPLGTTPLRLTFDRAARLLELRLDKRGYRSETVQIDLAEDSARKVSLRPRPRPVVDPDELRKL